MSDENSTGEEPVVHRVFTRRNVRCGAEVYEGMKMAGTESYVTCPDCQAAIEKEK